ncbi:hypothetical protein GN956_G7063 [Arapaima gigas]
MAVTWEGAVLEQSLSTSAGQDQHGDLSSPSETPGKELLDFSEEVLLVILEWLDPFSLLKAGSTCLTLYRLSSCDSMWRHHFEVWFGTPFPTASCSMRAKEAFRLLYMWKTIYLNVECNPPLQQKLMEELPHPPARYWMLWLVLEDSVPLPALRLTWEHMENLWGIPQEELEKEKRGAVDEDNVLWFEWKELHHLAVLHHGSVTMVFQHVLNKHFTSDHSELELFFQEYRKNRFQWQFTYWLFYQPEPLDKQLRSIYLQWRPHCKRKVSYWGEPGCDVAYLASLHPITNDYWLGKLANGDENIGIQTLDSFFSMCKSLMAWILGRDWGRMKRRKVYEDTLEGVYRQLRYDMHHIPIDHDWFWQVAKVQMNRVCVLLDTATNYVNWRLIKVLPYYRLYLLSGNNVYLDLIQGFLGRKRQVHNWMHLEENAWVMPLLSDELRSLLEFDTKITEDGLHGDSAVAQLSRVLWLYLHSGEQVYLDSLKTMVLSWANANLGYFSSEATSPLSHLIW